MPALTSIFQKLFRAGSHLSALEKSILDCVREHLDAHLVQLWDMQVQAINKIQRLPGGVEIDFYRIKGGNATFDSRLAFPNKKQELPLATVRIQVVGTRSLAAEIWCVRGFLSQVEYSGDPAYFEETLGMDPRPDFAFTFEKISDLGSSSD